jgi:hypothetical protein
MIRKNVLSPLKPSPKNFFWLATFADKHQLFYISVKLILQAKWLGERIDMICSCSSHVKVLPNHMTLGMYGIKARCYLEHPWGTYWEFNNPLGTWREQRKNEKNPPPTPSTQNLKEKKWRHLECMPTYPLAACIFYFQNYWSTFLA